ncbi:hypothetical protein HO173_011716 [Letharia columbiana]|uniref:Uncharacterized protein n=1 Tax=Letharia columbiana TaxID=112416 RepID=A0A8H6FHF3_9LECA|nr:uncharacterized protein HO173_011716 [Letharia columbiana]KAF6228697.1 hypothetical protein HO173_011716 [Letharia columbiana]
MSDGEDDYDSESDGYDIHDPRTREHEAYKIAQENAGRAARRFKYGDDVDADGNDYHPREEDNGDSMELRLQNAREARGWAFDEASRRYEWNARWTGGCHDGVEEEADKRMADVERWNGEIEKLERHVDQARDARTHNLDNDSDSSSDKEESADDSNEEYEKNVRDAREARERRYDHDDHEEEQGAGEYNDVDDDLELDSDYDSELDSHD